MTTSNATPVALTPDALRWRCDPARFDFESTADVEPVRGIIGQETAVEALRFGLACRASGQNIFVRGLAGTGRMTLVRRLLEEMEPRCTEGCDRCYVHDFTQPDRPRLINIPKGTAKQFRRLVDRLADFIRDDLRQALSSEGMTARKTALESAAETRIKAMIEPLDHDAREAGLTLVTVQTGPVSHTTLFPLIDGKPVPPEQFELLRQEGRITEDDVKKLMESRDGFAARMNELNRAIHNAQREHVDGLRKMLQDETRAVLFEFVNAIVSEFPIDAVRTFLTELVDDVIENGLAALADDDSDDFTRRYRVNILIEHPDDARCPIIIENVPTMTNLLGAVDREIIYPGASRTDHLMIRAGSLLRGDGGYLIMEARDVLSEPGAWKMLIRTLRSGRLEIVPPELSLPWLGQTIKPEPIEVDVKVILLGDGYVFQMLDSMDPDFPNLFKLLADFDSAIPRDDASIHHYAGLIARIAHDEGLPPFDRTAVAALIEHGSRIASRAGKLTARFGRLVDIAREAAFIAGNASHDNVTGDDVEDAVRRTKRRAELPSRRFREAMIDGTIRVQTRDAVIGQMNGLAVGQAGSLTSGFPARITATIGPGTAGVINIEREAALSGAIHTKGFYILGGLLRHLLQTSHPLAFTASIAFEQTYGGIDGDSASGAEICCLISALTDAPIRQELAMTGAIDQMGNVLSIGAVNEKIEGFFDVCRDMGLTGSHGVIIPRSNASDLMLREDIVEAASAGQFHVYAIDHIAEALTLLTGTPAGERNGEGEYPEGSLLALAVERARDFWLRVSPPTAVIAVGAEEAAEGGETADGENGDPLVM